LLNASKKLNSDAVVSSIQALLDANGADVSFIVFYSKFIPMMIINPNYSSNVHQ